jgi:hypothetical protein
VEQQNLAVALAAIPWFGSFRWFADFDNDHVPMVPLARHFVRMRLIHTEQHNLQTRRGSNKPCHN